MRKLNVMKRTLAGVLAVLTVAATTLPANVGGGGFLTGNTEIVAQAETGTTDPHVKECSSETQLESYLRNASDGDIIKVTADFSAPNLRNKKVPLPTGCLVTLDLNGHKITFGGGGDVFGVLEGSALIVKDGTMDFFDTDNTNAKGIIILCNVKVENDAWLGNTTAWVVNGSTIQNLSTESGQINPGSTLNPVGNNQNNSGEYAHENFAPAMIGSGVKWACYQDLAADFAKVNENSATYSNILLLQDSVLTGNATLSASNVVMDFSQRKLTTGAYKFAIANNSPGTDIVRNGTIEGDLDLTSGNGAVELTNLTVTGDINNAHHPITFDGGFYKDLTTVDGKMTIKGGYYAGDLNGPANAYEISGGYFVNEPAAASIKESCVVIPVNVTVGGVTYTKRVVPTFTLTFDANEGSLPQGVDSTKTVTYTLAYGDLPTPTRVGYGFLGWYTKSSGGDLVTSTSAYESFEDTTLYAHWEEIATFTLGDIDESTGKFPAAAGTGDKKYKSLLIAYGEAPISGESLTLPSVSGFVKNANASTNYSTAITMANGKTPAEIAAYVKQIVFNKTADHAGQTIHIAITDEVLGDKTFYFEGTGHYYQYVPFTSTTNRSWFDAYYGAKNLSYAGREGYLATITSLEEDKFIYNAAQTVGWLGGTTIKASGSEGMYSTYDVTSINNAKTWDSTHSRYYLPMSYSEDHWYWASGPERGQTFYSSYVVNSSSHQTSLDAGYYFNWNDGEPSNSAKYTNRSDEQGLTTLPFGTGYQYSNGSPADYSWNDIPYWNEDSASGYRAQGYFVEYGDQVFGDSGAAVTNSLNGSTTIQAKVTYNANGATSGTVPTDANRYDRNSNVTVLGNDGNLAKTSYSFAGWNTKADGTGATYAAGNTFAITAHTTLYAKWTALPATAPTVTDPASLELDYGYTSGNTLSVTAKAATDTDYTLSYQWYRSTTSAVSGFEKVTGATSASYTVPTGKDSGTVEFYKCEVTATRADNAETATATSGVASVSVAEPAVTIQGWTYGNTPNAPSVTGYAGTAAVTYTYSGTTESGAIISGYTTAPTMAGLYTVTASLGSSKTVSAEFRIAKREVGISWGDTDVFSCDGDEHCPTATFTNVLAGDANFCTPVISGASAASGSHTATVTGITGAYASNYKLPANGTTKDFTILTKLDLTDALSPVTYITSYTYDGTTITSDFADEYEVLCGKEIVLKSHGVLKFPEGLDYSKSKRNGIYTYTFTIPEGTSEVKVNHEYLYYVTTDENDSTLLIGYDRNDTQNSSSSMFELAKLNVNNTEYLQPLEVVVTPFENIFLNVESVTYEFTPDTNDVALVNDTPFYVGDYTVTAGARVEEADYWLSDSFSITPRAYAAHTDEITAKLAQSKYNYSGNDITPVVIVTDSNDKLNEDTLVEGVDYDLS
nr:InlB B-repeat-containing protein [Oscillospiraceae bacterium]